MFSFGCDSKARSLNSCARAVRQTGQGQTKPSDARSPCRQLLSRPRILAEVEDADDVADDEKQKQQHDHTDKSEPENSGALGRAVVLRVPLLPRGACFARRCFARRNSPAWFQTGDVVLDRVGVTCTQAVLHPLVKTHEVIRVFVSPYAGKSQHTDGLGFVEKTGRACGIGLSR